MKSPQEKMKSPRERAARALCRNEGNPENAVYEGMPMWMSYLAVVDAVLKEALGLDVWESIRELGPAEELGTP